MKADKFSGLISVINHRILQLLWSSKFSERLIFEVLNLDVTVVANYVHHSIWTTISTSLTSLYCFLLFLKMLYIRSAEVDCAFSGSASEAWLTHPSWLTRPSSFAWAKTQQFGSLFVWDFLMKFRRFLLSTTTLSKTNRGKRLNIIHYHWIWYSILRSR